MDGDGWRSGRRRPLRSNRETDVDSANKQLWRKIRSLFFALFFDSWRVGAVRLDLWSGLSQAWVAAVLVAVSLEGGLCAGAAQEESAKSVAAGSIVAEMTAQGERVGSLVKHAWVRQWIEAASRLPAQQPRTVTVEGREVVVDESLYYYSRYGSPLAYARALDLACEAGFDPKAGSRVLDFGYGGIGQLGMLAHTGCDAVGVDVAPLLKAIYAGSGGVWGPGSVTVFDGRFPAEPELVEAIGGDFGLVLSKNVLKRGYIHPAREVASPRQLIDLGVDDADFLAHVHRALRPGGLFVIYNFCPAKAPAEQNYIPWADGESPFDRGEYEAAGLEVLAFDVVDDGPARELASALGWDREGGMDLPTGLFAWYTIARRKAAVK